MIINNAFFGKIEFFNPFFPIFYYTMNLNELWSAFMRIKKFILLIYFSEREFAKYMCIYNNLEY